MKNLKIKNVSKGINAQVTNAILMMTGCILTVLLLFFSRAVHSKYHDILSVMNDYADCNKAVSDFRDSSAYLTNQARLYSVNLNLSYLDNYFYEKNSMHRRENAVQIIEMTHKDDSVDYGINMALRESTFLGSKELYAMALVAQATKIDFSILPEEIQNLKISDEDMALSYEKKLEAARNILFNSEYISAVDKISTYCNNVTLYLANDYINKQSGNSISIKSYFGLQFMAVIILFIVIIGLYVFLMLLVLIPLNRNCHSIEKGNKMIVKGCQEVRLISQVFNNLYDKNAVTASELKHKAEHDPLTDVINRNGFNKIKEALKKVDEPIAYLIIDIDYFKTINDTYGHLVGDEVLKKIANLLTEQFRNSDYVARIGGDEFAIVMTKIGTTPVSVIQKKIENINKYLQDVEENKPKVSLSVGVAISESGFIERLEEQADKALYKVKNGGRCNCSFYSEVIDE